MKDIFITIINMLAVIFCCAIQIIAVVFETVSKLLGKIGGWLLSLTDKIMDRVENGSSKHDKK